MPTPLSGQDSLGLALCFETVILPAEKQLSNECLFWGVTYGTKLSVKKNPTFQLTKTCYRTSGVFDISFLKMPNLAFTWKRKHNPSARADALCSSAVGSQKQEVPL